MIVCSVVSANRCSTVFHSLHGFKRDTGVSLSWKEHAAQQNFLLKICTAMQKSSQAVVLA